MPLSTHTAQIGQTRDYEAGVAAANDIWCNCNTPDYIYPYDPQTLEFAAGALAEFERLQRRDRNGMGGKIAAGAQAGAQQLNVEKWHGLIEVVQNADDLGAREVDFLLERRDTGATILHMCHNGTPVLVEHVMAMTYAFVSTKSNDPNATGRFGVGLKTLGRLGGRLEVHSGTYSFATEDQLTRAIPQVTGHAGNFFDLARGDTLLSLTLDAGIDCAALTDWFGVLKSSLLLFLKSVTRVSLDTVEAVHDLELVLDYKKEIAPGIWQRALHDGDVVHVVFERRIEVPTGMSRTGKATGAQTTVAIAATASCKGRLYATLPTRIETKLPFALNADFDPGTSRENLLDIPWNTWLLEEVGRLVADAVVTLFRIEPAMAWYLVPLIDEADCNDSWLKENLKALQAAAHASIACEARLDIDGRSLALDELCYMEENLEGALEPGDAELACPGQTLVPVSARDDGAFRVVLESFSAGLIDLRRAFSLFDQPETAGRDAAWCARLVKLAIDNGMFELLTKHRCFVLEEGRTALLPIERASAWLTLASAAAPLKRLRLVTQLVDEYRSVPDWEEIEAVLTKRFNFRHTISSAGYLEALAARSTPVHLSPDELGEVRKLMEATGSASLGHRLGHVIELDAFEYRRGGRMVECRTLAAHCYLPKRIAKDRNGAWHRAAEGVEGIFWAAPSYAKSLIGTRGRDRLIAHEKGARRFLQELGCEIAPRLVPRPDQAIIPKLLFLAQQAALPPKAARLVHDFDVPDLDRVLVAMAKMKKRDMAERSLTLFGVLSSSWERLYADKTKARAEWDEKKRTEHGEVPATWLVRAMSTPWLLNGKRQIVAPPGLAIGTDVNRAIYGSNPERIALGLTEADATSGLPQALGMLVAPDARELISQLRRLKECDRSEWPGQGTVLMRALAERCDRWRPTTLRSTIDGLQPVEVRHMLESERLLYLTRYNDWTAPSQVMLGPDIFGGRRLFVQAGAHYGQLWKVLQIRTVKLSDCLAVIDEIGEQKVYLPKDKEVLFRAFQQIERQLGSASDDETRLLSRLPLWTGERFHRTRPIFVAADPALVTALSGPIKFWHAPFDALARPLLLRSLKVTLLGPESLRVVGCEMSNVVPLDVAARYCRAVAMMKDQLLREDNPCYQAVRWDHLESAVLVVADTLALQVDVHLGRGDQFSKIVPVSAHAEETARGIYHYYRDMSAIGSDADGGRLIAACFEAPFRMRAAPFWYWAWNRAENAEVADTLELASEEAGDDRSLEELAAASVGMKRKKIGGAGIKNNDKGLTKEPELTRPAPVVLKLKPLGHFKTVTAAVVNQGAEGGGQQSSQGRGLKRGGLTGGQGGNSGGAGGAGAPGGGNGQQVFREYTNCELEAAGFAVLEHLFNGGDESCKAELYDFRAKRGIGSDMVVGVEQVRQWVELKSCACDLPASVILSRNEFSRAREEGTRFYLAIVSGLAMGFETVVRLYRDPVVTMPWMPSGTVAFGGLGKAHCLECRLIHEPVQEDDICS